MNPTSKLSMTPIHIGVIMDGNGRWAQKRGLARTQGHIEGLKAGKRIAKAASDMGVPYVTFYVFSTENWKRAADEVGFIMGLARQYLRAEFAFSRENNIRVRYTGDLSGLPPDVAQDIIDTCVESADFTGTQVVLAINYGGRDEIVRSVRRALAEEHEISGETISAHLDNPDIPDPDLVIRTAGEKRMSNFLLWESAYAEFYFSEKLWPDWTADDLSAAIEDFRKRERRFGGINGIGNRGQVFR
ncbi:MAG: di-trans,poly-cis-decaprenylcistransferase [Treponema sp.]|jgi:undecaprenyl diphosphate synthase|nr:di-trans,poly-cis-decaprenylcistransferase [Treponema sp.]